MNAPTWYSSDDNLTVREDIGYMNYPKDKALKYTKAAQNGDDPVVRVEFIKGLGREEGIKKIRLSYVRDAIARGFARIVEEKTNG